MSSDEVDKKTVEENPKDTTSSEEEAEEKTNSKPAAKKKADPPKIKQPAKKRVKTEQVEKESKKEEKKKEDKKKEKQEEKKEEEEEEEDEDSTEENGVENHKAVPLLDQPLEVSGSRNRRETIRFKPVEQKEEHKVIQIPEGKGKALGEIPRVELGIQRAKVDDLKLLHRLCFGKPGKADILKKNIRKFKGYEFEEASDDYEKKKVTIEKGFKKVTVAHLKNICNIIDIEKSGTKDDILARILSFLTCPVDSGKTMPGEGRTKRKGALSKNYDEGEERFDAKKKLLGKSKKKGEDSDESGKESENEKEVESDEEQEVKQNNKKKEDSQTTEDSEPEEEKEEEEKPKKGGKKGKKVTETAAEKKAPPKKRGVAKKAPEKKPEVEKDEDEDNDSESDEPQSKKPKAPPTDEEIKTYVKSLLEGANLELITMKKVCQDVYAHYPDFDLGHKKDFIKTTVKSLISS
uniref:Protein DEK n=1 Tax=Graphocephala atropunctata TaxID=36148 RepID=A0A1B6MIJ9_9HEMI